MKLGDLELDAEIVSISEVKKTTIFEPLFSDVNTVEETGQGATALVVAGVVCTAAARDALQVALRAKGIKKLYFTSEDGATENDRYYKVQTLLPQWEPLTPSDYPYTFTAIAGDPRVWVSATDLAVA